MSDRLIDEKTVNDINIGRITIFHTFDILKEATIDPLESLSKSSCMQRRTGKQGGPKELFADEA